MRVRMDFRLGSTDWGGAFRIERVLGGEVCSSGQIFIDAVQLPAGPFDDVGGAVIASRVPWLDLR